MANDKLLQIRISDVLLNILDDWRRKQRPIPARSKAVRLLIEATAKQRKSA